MHCLDMFNGVAADSSRQPWAVRSRLTALLAAAGTVPTRESAQGHPIQDVVYYSRAAKVIFFT